MCQSYRHRRKVELKPVRARFWHPRMQSCAVFAPAHPVGISDNSSMASIDLALLRRLARTSATGDPYAFCSALPCLGLTASDAPAWLGDHVRALSKLGLAHAAGHLVAEHVAGDALTAEYKALLDALAKMPPGRIEWRSRKPRFRANLKALQIRDTAAASTLERVAPELDSQFELHQCLDGNYQIRNLTSAWPNQWLPCFDDHQSIAPSRVHPNPSGQLQIPLIFEGLGLGWELLNGYARSADGFLGAQAAIYCIETNLLHAAILFHLHDMRPLLEDARVCWFIGDDAVQRFREWLTRDSTWALTDRLCSAPLVESATVSESVIDVLSAVADARQDRKDQLSRMIDERYSGRDAAWWARRFAEAIDARSRATGRPLRILGLTSVHTSFLQYSMRDCLHALEKLGHQTRLVIEPTKHRCTDGVFALQAQLDFEPDLVLLLSRMRDEMTGLVHPAIPAVAWDQDALPWVLNPTRNPKLAWNDFLMGVTAFGARRRFGWPPHRCEYCAIAGSPDTYSAESIPDDELTPYRADVSYVSHASAPPESVIADVATWIPQPALQTVFHAALKRLMPAWKAGGPHPGPIMSAVFDAAAECGMQKIGRDELTRVAQPLHRVGDRVFRHVALDWIADWADQTGRTLALWGTGWDAHPRFARYARGPSRNGEELRHIYQASKINLQLMQMGFFHQRALDGLMAGGFVLGRRSDADETGPVLRRLVALLDQHQITTFPELMAIPDISARNQIESAMRRCGEDPRMLCTDYIENRRLTAEADFVDERIPGFGDILFASREDFVARAEKFLTDDAGRRAWAAKMRDVLIRDYSYHARMARMLTFVKTGFEIDAAGAAPIAKSVSSRGPAATPALMASGRG